MAPLRRRAAARNTGRGLAAAKPRAPSAGPKGPRAGAPTTVKPPGPGPLARPQEVALGVVGATIPSADALRRGPSALALLIALAVVEVEVKVPLRLPPGIPGVAPRAPLVGPVKVRVGLVPIGEAPSNPPREAARPLGPIIPRDGPEATPNLAAWVKAPRPGLDPTPFMEVEGRLVVLEALLGRVLLVIEAP